MLSENIKTIRKQKGFTQEELATRLHVVRQTVSKWEKGLSVPDADVILTIASELDVSVQELLGAEIRSDANRNEIAEQLSRINEQMATRNRRSALIWKVVGLILSVILIFSLAYIFFGGRSQSNQLATIELIELPDTVELYNISLSKNDSSLVCSFVPSVGNDKLIYLVTLHCLSYDIQDQVASAEYSNGICTVEFTEKLLNSVDYNMTLNISNETDERNVTIFTSLSQHDSGYSWSTPWNQ
ncbi:MAG: helix-turn-helix domain-containing protein [Saccharofermentanales bacterium]